MKTLFLVRHAHAANGSTDHDRPLSVEGAAAAEDIARQLAAFSPRPQLILSSPARRTLETADALQKVLDGIPLETDPALYLADTERLMDIIRRLTDQVEDALVLAHNPGLGQLAFDLGGASHPLIARGFTPATVAVFECRIDVWGDFHPGTTRLRHALGPGD